MLSEVILLDVESFLLSLDAVMNYERRIFMIYSFLTQFAIKTFLIQLNTQYPLY